MDSVLTDKENLTSTGRMDCGTMDAPAGAPQVEEGLAPVAVEPGGGLPTDGSGDAGRSPSSVEGAASSELGTEPEDNSGDDSDFEFSEDGKKDRWDRGTPDGARRSKRVKGETAEGEAIGDGAAAGDAVAAGAESGGASRGPSEAPPEVVGSPEGLVLRREHSAERVDADLRVVQGMWEMAAVLDFLHLFRRADALGGVSPRGWRSPGCPAPRHGRTHSLAGRRHQHQLQRPNPEPCS